MFTELEFSDCCTEPQNLFMDYRKNCEGCKFFNGTECNIGGKPPSKGCFILRCLGCNRYTVVQEASELEFVKTEIEDYEYS